MACNLRTARVFTSSKSAPACVALPSRSSRRSVRVEARARVVGMGVFGTKAGMMSFFTPEGLCMPATVLALEEGNIVTQVKTEATDGYDAVQVGYKVVAQRKVPKPELGHLKKGECPPMRHLREYRVSPGPSQQKLGGEHADGLGAPPRRRSPDVLFLLATRTVQGR